MKGNTRLLTRREFFGLIARSSAAVTLSMSVPVSADRRRAIHEGYFGFTVNGRAVEFRVGREVSLLEFLRTDMGLTGAKYGCGTGVCGACTVLVNNRPVRSCVVNTAHLDGLHVTTVEGIGGIGSLDPIQETFKDLCVFQCGYCAAGFVLVTRALLDKTSTPSPEQIRDALYGNLCRCTGYQQIMDAVRAINNPEFKRYLLHKPHSGVRTFGGDVLAEQKVTGTLPFACDHRMQSELYAKVVWSSHPHARILAVDVDAATRLPGVVRVLTHKDIPGKKTFGSIIPDQPVLASERVRFRGDAVALVLAESRDAAGRGADKVSVSYEELPAVFTPEDSLAPEAPQLHPKGNICSSSAYAKGEVEEGRRLARFTVRYTYRTPFVEHAYLETESCLTYIDEGGVLVVVSASQDPLGYQRQIASVCAVPKERVQMKTTVAGGAFGAKGDMTIQHLCALGTLVTGRPVRLGLTRKESIRVHAKRHPFTLTYETGVHESGILTHCVVEGLADAGAYNSATLAVVDNAAVFATGPYQINHSAVKITAAFTNNPICGAMRGFGVPQVCFAMERQMDRLAALLGMDPFDLRMKNALEKGKIAQWGQVMGEGVGVKACLASLKRAIEGAGSNARPRSSEKVGIGIACGYKNASSPTQMPFGKADVTFSLSRHGRFVIYVGGSELGQGLVTSLAYIASDGLGIASDQVDIVFGSTRHTQSPVMTTSSQQVFLTGAAILDGAPRFRAVLCQAVSKVWHVSPEDLKLGPEGVVHEGSGERVASYHEVAWRSRLAGNKLVLHHHYVPPVKTVDPPGHVRTESPKQRIVPSLGYCAQAAVVVVNEKTGEIRVEKIFASQDVGRAVNPVGIEGQIRGAVVMGLGWCVRERFRVADGYILTPDLDTYFIPRTKDVPEIVPLFVEVPDPLGPGGAKGIGELPLLPTAPAVCNAIRDAVGAHLSEIPLSATAVKKELEKADH